MRNPKCDAELRAMDAEIHRKVFDPARLRLMPVYHCPESALPTIAPADWLATKTLGTELDWCFLPHFEPLGAPDFLWKPLPRYSASMAHAWLVVEKLRERTSQRWWRVEVNAMTGKHGEPQYMCAVYAQSHCGTEDPVPVSLNYAETAPLSICQAALKAVLPTEPE